MGRRSFYPWLVVVSILSCLFSHQAPAQERIRILSHEFSPADVTVGDAVQLRIVVEADEKLQIHPEPVDLSGLQQVEAEKPQVNRLEQSITGKALYEVIYPLRAFAPGKQTLSPITIRYTGLATNDASLQTPPYTFEVRSIKPPGATEMKGIKPPLSPPGSLLPYILFAMLAIALIGALVFLYLRKRAKPEELSPGVPSQSAPHQIAYEQLNRLEGMNLIAQGEMKAYHTEISQIIRQYIDARYDIPALELTTADLLARLRAEEIGEETLGLLRNLLGNCDLVKFARYQPSKPKAHERMVEARHIIDATKPLWAEERSEDV